MKSSFTGYCTTTYSLFHLGYIYLTTCLGTPTINFPSPPLLIKVLWNQKNGWAFQTDFSRISDFVYLPLNSRQFFITFTYTHKKKTIYHMQLVLEISQITSKIIWKSLEKKECSMWCMGGYPWRANHGFLSIPQLSILPLNSLVSWDFWKEQQSTRLNGKESNTDTACLLICETEIKEGSQALHFPESRATA